LVTGTFFGLRAFALKRDAQQQCDGSACSRRGLELYDDVDRAAAASTVAFSVGLVSGGLGVYLMLRDDHRGPPAASTSVVPQHRGGYAAIAGSW
jgi:hypothetical protein